MESIKCLNCSSDNILKDMYVRDSYGKSGFGSRPMSVEKDRDPDAFLFKETMAIPLKAHICADCKYVMFFGTREVYQEEKVEL